MSTEFKLPELGENITAGDVVRVLVKAGDKIEKDQPVLELETDKATIEVPSSVSGTIGEIKVKQGDKVKVGQTVLTVDDGGAATGKGEATGKAEKSARAETSGKADPAAADASAKDASAKSEKKAEKPKRQPAGAPVEGGLSQEAPEAESEEPAPRAAARADRDDESGTVEEAPEAQRAEPVEAPAAPRKRGEVVEISRGTRAPAAQAQSEPEPEPVNVPAAPSVRRLARELGVDIRVVPGSGPGGRISADDVQAYVREALSKGGPSAPAIALPDFARWGEVERKPMSNIRRKTAERLGYAWSVIPHVTQHDKADITALEALRKQYSPQAEKAGGKLTVTAIALKIVERALGRFPHFNSSIDLARNEIVYKKSRHIGVAADTERGLLVPIIRDVDRKGIIELAVELAKASEKARSGKLSLDDMQGGSFTITNLGGIGGTAFTPIVNWPEVAILGISRGAHEPVWNGQAFEPRLMLPLSLSYDHRVIDGADAARFLRWVAEAFEQPFVLAL
jgi:pyruvate dehydrogenase E2 component (dihydrolipoyllysine-residue acetyltransferase)